MEQQPELGLTQEAYIEKINSHTRASPNYLPAVWKAIKQIERSSSVHSYYFINQN